MALKSIGDNLIIQGGKLTTKDGTPLDKYLAKFFKEGQSVNIVDHKALIELNNDAQMSYTQCA